MDTQESNPLFLLDDQKTCYLFRFRKGSDYLSLSCWLKKRGLPSWPIDELPEMGYVAYQDSVPRAAAFLRHCEGNIGLFDSLIADPDCPFHIRTQCIDLLVKQIFMEARKKGIRKIIAYSINERTLERSKKHGFILQSHKVISMIL